MENKIVVQDNSPAEMIRAAVNGNADLDKLEKLLELQIRWDGNEAKKKFNSAMVDVHKEIPAIGKTLPNTQTGTKYAALDEIICKTKPVYTEKGFSVSFHEGECSKDDHIRICADVVHREGHKESYYYDVPLDGVGIKGNANMTKIHAKASSTSYGRRYLMCMIWNIPTGDDNDGNGEPEQYIDDAQLNHLRDLIIATKTDESKFIEYLKIEKLEILPANKYKIAETPLLQKYNKLKKGETT